ncbi:hypothetical protein [Gordonia shandongensis]|uniref:hypothetical protein n=1 Tax=Gordonia shandongensis TaxID=376351 RepID=UPI0004198FE0|nr:hypothetical protein [Gordonia shandongensis]
MSVADTLAARGLVPTAAELEKIEAKWAEISALKKDLATVDIDDADIALRNLPGGDHVE